MTLTTLYRAAIGPINTDYYLPLFEQFEAAGQAGVSWNTSACLYHLNWMIFRGMWRAALAYATVLLMAAWALVSLGGLSLDGPLTWVHGGLIASVILALALPGLWGNALFFSYCHKALMAAVAANPTIKTACAQLRRQAGSRQRFVRILLANVLLLAAAGVGWLTTAVDTATPEPVAPSAPVAVPASGTSPAASIPSASASAASAAQPTASDLMQEVAAPASAPAAAIEVPLPAASTAAPPVATSSAVADLKPAVSRPPPQLFYVNAGLFANADNARKVLDKLQQAGLPAGAQVLEMPKGTRTRVRVGPYAKRAQAQAAMAKIRALKLDAALASAN